MKIRGLIGICGLMLMLVMLVGCSAEAENGDTSSNEKENISVEEIISVSMDEGDPIGIQEGLVSQEFYDKVKDYMKENASYVEKDKEFELKMEEYDKDEMHWEKEFIDSYIKFLDDYANFLTQSDLEYATDQEYKLSTHLGYYGDYKSYSVFDMTDYLKTFNDKNLEDYYSSRTDATLMMSDIGDLLREYKLIE